MADNPQHSISPGQLVVVILSSQLGLGILSLPRIAAAGFGRGGWLVVLAMGLLSLFGTALIILLGRRYQGSILAANRALCGPIIGTCLNIPVILILLATTIVNLATYVHSMKILFFRRTPFLVLAAFLLLPVIFVSAKGLKVIARFDSFVYIALLTLTAMAAAAWESIEPSFLLPLLEVKTAGLLRTLPAMATAYTGFELFLIFNPWVRERKFVSGAFTAVGLTVLILTGFTAFITAMFGPEFTARQVYPLFNLVRTLEAPVLGRLDIYFIMIWLPAMGAAVTAFFIAAQLALVEFLPCFSYRTTLAALSLSVLTGVYFLTDFDLTERLVGLIAATGFILLGLALPALLLILSLVKGVRR